MVISKFGRPLSCGVFSDFGVLGFECSVVDRFSAVSDESSLKAAELPAYLHWSKLKLHRM